MYVKIENRQLRLDIVVYLKKRHVQLEVLHSLDFSMYMFTTSPISGGTLSSSI